MPSYLPNNEEDVNTSFDIIIDSINTENLKQKFSNDFISKNSVNK